MFDVNDDHAAPSNPGHNDTFHDVVERAFSRRALLKSGAGLSAALFLGGLSGSLSAAGLARSAPAPLLGFAAVAASSGDEVVVPPGYTARVLYRWGDPLFAHSPAWRGDAGESGAEQALQAGDNLDGMHFFPLTVGGRPSGSEGLLVVNHEYCNYEYLFAPGGDGDYLAPWTADKVTKAQNAHGVSVVHVKKQGGVWKVQRGSRYNRRLTGNSPMTLSGPAAGHALLKTAADASGTAARGTLNNCANGVTPWGTYLSCEENFNAYFATAAAGWKPGPSEARYGLSAAGAGYRWHEHDARFDLAATPNEPNRFGWVVEIDPFDPASTPKKRTALGRFKHENACVVVAADGRVVVYMGDDERFEYIYKFVSDGVYDPRRPAANRDLLDRGRLYVARFDAGAAGGDFAGSGEWLLLDKHANATLAADARFADQAEVLIRARQAADAVGATRMDRPEWIARHPASGELYCTLTNNSSRTAGQVDDANPRAANRWGQIVRWREAGGDHTATRFEWDLFVLAGNPIAYPDRGDPRSGSANVTADNSFNSPDGLAFDADGRLWIQTDGNFSNAGHYAGQGNNQMLCADPASKEIRRFLVGPSGCEITGLSFTPDSTTMFVNIQHPGEAGEHPRKPTGLAAGQSMEDYLARHPLAFSRWPDDGAGGRPRSATVVITKDDGGRIGS
ncbi:PhoX family protein [Crenobacter luteus]|uniref:Transcriptional initiation protein Tat n=1 Tax=Crenobacter luteus TaxID=1452487 RepID=A0A163CLC0_9NEIS|nr:PhoX family phosphatase [Crenobacter luteus]KZE32707.1 transcriptional initiation protein Tat [Crenobacter luteus]